jgi:hypothetical protein
MINTFVMQQEGEEEKPDEPRIVQYVQRKKPSLFKVYKGEFWVVLHRYALLSLTFTCCNKLSSSCVAHVCSKFYCKPVSLLYYCYHTY